MNTFWRIYKMEVKPVEAGRNDVVVTAHWSFTARDQGQFEATYGTTEFTAVSDSFTPYTDLMEQQVLDWCYQSNVNKADVEANTIKALQDKLNPPVVEKKLPWIP